jgi:predicted nucleic acid-binding protein
MDRSLLDTSTVSDVIQPATKRFPTVADHLQRYLRAHRYLTFSEISCYEVLRGLRKKNASSQLRQFQAFCQRCELLPVSYEVLDKAAALWADGQRRGMVVDDSDLIIAATSLMHDLPIVTANPKHFEWVGGLKLSNWREP